MQKNTDILDPEYIFDELGLKSGMIIGDFGCGHSGYFVFPSARRVGETGMVYAVDIQRNVLQVIQRRMALDHIENITPIWANLELSRSSGIPDASLDAVALINVLFQSSKKSAILREVFRTLKPGGSFLLIDWKYVKSSLGPPLEHRVSETEILRLADEVGFHLKRQFQPGPYHQGFILIR